MIEFPDTLPIARYHFTFKVSKAFNVYNYDGSMLRGVFGHQLKRLCCITSLKDCKQCLMYHSCVYPTIFETPVVEHSLQNFKNIPSPFIIEPLAPVSNGNSRVYKEGDLYKFSMVLCGRALKELPYVCMAFNRAFEKGVTKDFGKAEIVSITVDDPFGTPAEIFNANQSSFKPHIQELRLPQEKEITKIFINLITPLRLQKNSKPRSTDNLSARDILIGLLRRISLLNDFHLKSSINIDFQQAVQLVDNIKIERHLNWYNWTRYSNRQKQKMNLGGLQGSIELSGNLKPFIPALYLGQWLHLGKNTSFGLGRYELEI